MWLTPEEIKEFNERTGLNAARMHVSVGDKIDSTKPGDRRLVMEELVRAEVTEALLQKRPITPFNDSVRNQDT